MSRKLKLKTLDNKIHEIEIDQDVISGPKLDSDK